MAVRQRVASQNHGREPVTGARLWVDLLGPATYFSGISPTGTPGDAGGR